MAILLLFIDYDIPATNKYPGPEKCYLMLFYVLKCACESVFYMYSNKAANQS